MIRALRVLLLAGVIGVLGTEIRAEDPVISHVRTSDGVLVGEASASADGVSVRLSDEENRVVTVPWFDIRQSDGWEIPEEYQRLARGAAIGHARRLRGDLGGCAEQYVPIVARYIGSSSPMAREVFSGLLDEALVRGDYFDASVMLALLGTSTLEAMDNRYDVHTGIPMLKGHTQRHRFEGFATMIAQSSGEHGSFRELGALIRGFDAIGDPELSDEQVLETIESMDASVRQDGKYHQGMELYTMMLRAQRHPEAQERREAREWLSSRTRMFPDGWYDAWCRCAIGASLLYESTLESDRGELVSQGVVELIHVMVRYRKENPGLARWALETATTALSSAGRRAEAAELVRSFDMRRTDYE